MFAAATTERIFIDLRPGKQPSPRAEQLARIEHRRAVSSTAGLIGEAITELLASADHEAKLLGRRGIVNRVIGGLSTAVDGPVSDVL